MRNLCGWVDEGGGRVEDSNGGEEGDRDRGECVEDRRREESREGREGKGRK